MAIHHLVLNLYLFSVLFCSFLSSHHDPGFRGAYFDEGHINIALEYMDRGSLADLMDQQGALSERLLAFAFEQVLMVGNDKKMGEIHTEVD